MSEMNDVKIAVPKEKAEEHLKTMRDAGYDADLSEDPDAGEGYECMTVRDVDSISDLSMRLDVHVNRIPMNHELYDKGYRYRVEDRLLTDAWFESEVASRPCPLCRGKLYVKLREVGIGCMIDWERWFGCDRCDYWFKGFDGMQLGGNRDVAQRSLDRFDKLTVLTEEGLLLMAIGAKAVAESGSSEQKREG